MKYVRKFGSDTEGLLDFVYKTLPMLQAAPNELLDFKVSQLNDQKSSDEQPEKKKLSRRQKKKRAEKLKLHRAMMQQKLVEKGPKKSKDSNLRPQDTIVFTLRELSNWTVWQVNP